MPIFRILARIYYQNTQMQEIFFLCHVSLIVTVEHHVEFVRSIYLFIYLFIYFRGRGDEMEGGR